MFVLFAGICDTDKPLLCEIQNVFHLHFKVSMGMFITLSCVYYQKVEDLDCRLLGSDF